MLSLSADALGVSSSDWLSVPVPLAANSRCGVADLGEVESENSVVLGDMAESVPHVLLIVERAENPSLDWHNSDVTSVSGVLCTLASVSGVSLSSEPSPIAWLSPSLTFPGLYLGLGLAGLGLCPRPPPLLVEVELVSVQLVFWLDEQDSEARLLKDSDGTAPGCRGAALATADLQSLSRGASDTGAMASRLDWRLPGEPAEALMLVLDTTGEWYTVQLLELMLGVEDTGEWYTVLLLVLEPLVNGVQVSLFLSSSLPSASAESLGTTVTAGLSSPPPWATSNAATILWLLSPPGRLKVSKGRRSVLSDCRALGAGDRRRHLCTGTIWTSSGGSPRSPSAAPSGLSGAERSAGATGEERQWAMLEEHGLLLEGRAEGVAMPEMGGDVSMAELADEGTRCGRSWVRVRFSSSSFSFSCCPITWHWGRETKLRHCVFATKTYQLATLF